MPVDKAARRDAYMHIDYEEVYNIVHMGLRYSSLSIFSLVMFLRKGSAVILQLVCLVMLKLLCVCQQKKNEN